MLRISKSRLESDRRFAVVERRMVKWPAGSAGSELARDSRCETGPPAEGPRHTRRVSSDNRAGGAAAVPGSWEHAGIEPAIDEMLHDPIVVTLMRRDRITREQIEALIREVTQRRRATALG